MSLSIYTSFYNIVSMSFAWREALANWSTFFGDEGGQIVVAVNTSTDSSLVDVRTEALLLNARFPSVEYTVLSTDVPYADPRFDGMIKDLALKACTRDFCILLDCDEILPAWGRPAWDVAAQALAASQVDALMLPVIDLFHDQHHYRSLGTKWYLHRNAPHLGRGVVAFARRPDGTIDITKSDTTELIDTATGALASFTYLMDPRLNDSDKLAALATKAYPYVIHTGWLDKAQRLRQSAFWTPVWNAREGREIERPKTAKDLNRVTYFHHGLPDWRVT